MKNHNPHNIQIGDWVILDNNKEHPVRVFSMTETKLFSEVGNHSSPIDTWSTMTNRLKPLDKEVTNE